MNKDININLTIKQGASEEEITALVAAEVKKHTKPKFPKWEQLGTISGWHVNSCNKVEHSTGDTMPGYAKHLWPTKELAEASLALLELARLRDYVNDGWKPDWTTDNCKHCITIAEDEVSKEVWCSVQYFLAFKDSETRDGFLEAYRDLIEVAKPLL